MKGLRSNLLNLNYPTERSKNLEYRSWILGECETDPERAEEVKQACARDIIYYINCFVYTKDPRRKPDVLPFILYPFQVKAILKIQESIRAGKDLLIEKSRDMGVSWMVLMVFEWFWLFESGSDFRVGSRKEEYVDKLNDIDTLIEKIRFDLKKKPLWMLPKGFNPEEHCGYMRVVNPENKNTIVGESANPNFGSGGRRKAILLDEFSKWDNSISEAAYTATADVTPCRMVVSTPVGSANKFALLANGTKEKIEKLTLHWTLHPNKVKGVYYYDHETKVPLNTSAAAFAYWEKQGRETGIVRSPWYDIEADRRSESDLAQEVDIDYLRSGHPFFSMKHLLRQRVWTYHKRFSPQEAIPFGKYIRLHLVDVDHKIEIREQDVGWLRVYELPQEGYEYVVSADTSEGLSKGDESALIVRNKYTRNVAACANGLYKPDELALMLQKTAKYYKEAEIAPENNNHGYAVCQDLQKLDCKVYWTVNDEGKATKAGWSTTPKTRPKMLDQLEEEIRREAIELRDEVLIQQCKTFIFNEKNGKPEAEGNFLDDMVIACAIGGIVIQEKPVRPKRENASKRSELYETLKRPAYSFGKK